VLGGRPAGGRSGRCCTRCWFSSPRWFSVLVRGCARASGRR